MNRYTTFHASEISSHLNLSLAKLLFLQIIKPTLYISIFMRTFLRAFQQTLHQKNKESVNQTTVLPLKCQRHDFCFYFLANAKIHMTIGLLTQTQIGTMQAFKQTKPQKNKESVNQTTILPLTTSKTSFLFLHFSKCKEPHDNRALTSN